MLTGLAAESTLAGGQNPGLVRRLLATAAMLLRAVSGAFLIFNVGSSTVLALTVALLACIAISAHRLSSLSDPWTAATRPDVLRIRQGQKKPKPLARRESQDGIAGRLNSPRGDLGRLFHRLRHATATTLTHCNCNAEQRKRNAVETLPEPNTHRR
jgi:hypothetical protein